MPSCGAKHPSVERTYRVRAPAAMCGTDQSFISWNSRWAAGLHLRLRNPHREQSSGLQTEARPLLITSVYSQSVITSQAAARLWAWGWRLRWAGWGGCVLSRWFYVVLSVSFYCLMFPAKYSYLFCFFNALVFWSDEQPTLRFAVERESKQEEKCNI